MHRLLIGLCLLLSCRPNNERKTELAGAVTVPDTYTDFTSADLSVTHDSVFYRGTPYSGHLFSLQPSGHDTAMLASYKNGLQEGLFRKWFPNGQLMEEREYRHGRKNGRQQAFWENGKPLFSFTAKDDAYEGELKEWNMEGNLIHLGNFVNGQEEGAQKLWYDNGKIRANYVIIGGKRYGLLGTKNCKNVSDSIFSAK